MKTNRFNDETVLCAINCYKQVKSSSAAASFISNLLAGGIAGSVPNNFRLTLTEENLYIETMGYCAWGGEAEVRYSDKISRSDIKSFDVKNIDSHEVVELVTNQNKTMVFIRDNEKVDNLALEMSKVF